MASRPSTRSAATPLTSRVPVSYLERYGAELYEFIYYLVGERDQAAYLLEDVFAHPGNYEESPERGLLRGRLYGRARAAALHYLGERNWLDALPPIAGPDLPGLPDDIWRAARAMPAFDRAVLIMEELAALPPGEKAEALGRSPAELPGQIALARASFNSAFDASARERGSPTSMQVPPGQLAGLYRRTANSNTLFGFLPPVALPDSLAATIRAHLAAHERRPAPVAEVATPRAVSALARKAVGQTRLPASPAPTSGAVGWIVAVVALIGLGILLLAVFGWGGGYRVLNEQVWPTVIHIVAPGGSLSTPTATLPASAPPTGTPAGPQTAPTATALAPVTPSAAATSIPFVAPSPSVQPSPTQTRTPTPTPTLLPTITATPVRLPDLVAANIALTALNQIAVTIRNDGNADAGGRFLVQVIANNAIVESDRPILNLRAGQQVELIVPEYRAVGVQVVTLAVNGQQLVEESSYSNNALTVTLIGPLPTPTRTRTPVPTWTSTATPTPTSTPSLTPVH